MEKMKITTILFDFVGVLMEKDTSLVVSKEVELIDERIGAVVDDHQFRAGVLNDFGYSEAQFESVLAQVVDRYQPFRPLWQILPDLHKRYALGIINNGTWITYPRFRAKYGIDQQFDVFISSALEGVRKPDPQIYLRACEKLKVLPNQCLFMDDNKDNVSAAVQLGMQGKWWVTHQTGMDQFVDWLSANEENTLLPF